MSSLHEVRAVESVVEVPIQASRAVVWETLTAKSTDWWHRDFYTGTNPRGFVFEARLGGRVYEDWGEGEGATWYTVTALRREEMLTLAGIVTCGAQGLETIVDKISLTDSPGGTTLRMETRALGVLSEDFAEQTQAGWTLLFGDCLKNFIEHGRRPPRPASVR